MNFNLLMGVIKKYNNNDLELNKIRQAYDLANKLHKGQYRKNGDPYIIHPLNVAYILATLEADTDTIIAGLLHDTLEDTECTKEMIATEFNEHVALLVDGVTKIGKMNFKSNDEAMATNTRKLLNGITEDVRIIYIKLADRLHNMRTLQFMPTDRQLAIATETMEIFVPIAELLGFYSIKNELAELSLNYTNHNMLLWIKNALTKYNVEHYQSMQKTMYGIQQQLDKYNIDNKLCPRLMKTIEIYKKINRGLELSDIHNLYSIKVLVSTIDECYKSLGIIHSIYIPNNKYLKDYIGSPKPNKYQSIHTTVFGEDDNLIQARIRTYEMDRIARLGLLAYWQDKKISINEELRNNFDFFKSLIQINDSIHDDKAFLTQIKKEMLGTNINVYTPRGKIIELPQGSTIIDFAYHINEQLGNQMIAALVNGHLANNMSKELKDGDIVKIITGESGGPKGNWLSRCKTAVAKQYIKQYLQ